MLFPEIGNVWKCHNETHYFLCSLKYIIKKSKLKKKVILYAEPHYWNHNNFLINCLGKQITACKWTVWLTTMCMPRVMHFRRVKMGHQPTSFRSWIQQADCVPRKGPVCQLLRSPGTLKTVVAICKPLLPFPPGFNRVSFLSIFHSLGKI